MKMTFGELYYTTNTIGQSNRDAIGSFLVISKYG